MAIRERIAALRQPEYTGSNRCRPCTVLNLLIAGLLAATTGWVLAVQGAGVAAAGAATGGVLAVAVAVIYLRGYLVPGTPWLTRAYAPQWLLDAVGKPQRSVPDQDAASAVERQLRQAGILTIDGEVSTDARTEWRDRREADETDPTAEAEFAGLLGATPDDLWMREYGGTHTVIRNGKQAGEWPAQERFVDDMAAAAMLRERVSGWETAAPRDRAMMLVHLRCAAGPCSGCGGELAVTTGSCCGSTEIIAARCGQCEADALELRIPG